MTGQRAYLGPRREVCEVIKVESKYAVSSRWKLTRKRKCIRATQKPPCHSTLRDGRWHVTLFHFVAEFFILQPNFMVEWLALMLRIREVPGSNVGPEILSFSCFYSVLPGKCRVITIISSSTTTHKESWSPSEVSSTLLDSWLLATNYLIPASLRPFPFHLSIWHAIFPLFLSFHLHIHQSPRHTVLIHSCNMTSPLQPCNSDYHVESWLFKKVITFLVKPSPPLVSALNRKMSG
jgi:hypothetical protein